MACFADKIEKVNEMYWKCNYPAFMSEIVNNNKGLHGIAGAFKVLNEIMFELAEVAREIDDPRLHLMMCRLSLYSCADQYDKDFDKGIFKKLEKMIIEQKNQKEQNAKSKTKIKNC